MKLKKVLAAVLAATMIMGMSVTTFAEGSTSTITITNGAGEQFSYYPIIVPNQKAKTGWSFASDGIKNAYLTAFTGVANNDQEVIEALIAHEAGTQSYSSCIADALKAIKNLKLSLIAATDDNNSDGDFTFTVDQAGVYYIEGLDTDHYVYSPMAAYVSFGKADQENQYPNGLADAEPIEAKGQPIYIGKTPDDEVVEIGRDVEYTIETVIPYFAPEVTDPTYEIVDTIKGATYAVEEEGPNKDKLAVEVYIGKTAADIDDATSPNYTIYVPVSAYSVSEDFDYTFTADLSDYLEGNANKDIVLKYAATVTDLEVNNKVIPGDGESEFTEGTTSTVRTATITLTKTGDEDKVLANAKFVLTDSDGKYATFKMDNGSYVLTGWTTNSYETSNGAEGGDNDGDGFVDANIIVTNASGQAVIKGLDGERTYTLKEVQAPEGYSLADDHTMEGTDSKYWTSEKEGAITIVDTTLASLPLPSTGGMGTTIFTIGGCAIMIAAAGLFFASRKKESK